MANVDRFEVQKGVYVAVGAAAPVKSVIGTPARLRTKYAPKNIAFPWVRMDFLPAVPWTRVKGRATRTFRIQFVAFDNSLTLANVTAALAAIADVMDAGVFTVVGGTVIETMPGPEYADYDPETGSPVGFIDYTLAVEPT